MPFENFYKADDEARRRWWKCFGLAILLFFGYWIFAYSSLSFDEPQITPQDNPPDSQTARAERLRRAEALCTYLPKPEQLRFLNVRPPLSDADRAEIFYEYETGRGFDEIMPTFLVWLDSNGWKLYDFQALTPSQISPTRTLTYHKDRQFISITYDFHQSSENQPSRMNHYAIACSEEEISFGIYD